MNCTKCKKDISNYKVYESYEIKEKKVCEQCWLSHMDSIPLNKLEKPDFTKVLSNI